MERLAKGGGEITTYLATIRINVMKPNVEVRAPQLKACLERTQVLASGIRARFVCLGGLNGCHKAEQQLC